MRSDLLGLDLDEAIALLITQGVRPAVQLTRAPRGAAPGERQRVVFASDDGTALIAAGFADPAAEAGAENG